MPATAPCSYVNAIRFSGHSCGQVKTFRGFKKGQHSVPDAINPATVAFLARLCTEELTEEAETVFQKARSLCQYKRKDVSLNTTPPSAQLTAKDFSLELAYGFDGENASFYRCSWTLTGFTDLEFLRSSACAELFDRRFTELVFSLTKGASVESVIDVIEASEGLGIEVNYPSDCSHCMLSVKDVDAQVRFDSTELAMVFQRGGDPGTLLDGFLAVREAFSLTKSRVLSGLLG